MVNCSDNWDVNISALFTLLYLIPPAPQGQGKGSRSKTADEKELLISFYKVYHANFDAA